MKKITFLLKIKHFFGKHIWKYKETPESEFRICIICGKKQKQIWDDFSSFYWCSSGYTKENLIDKLSE